MTQLVHVLMMAHVTKTQIHPTPQLGGCRRKIRLFLPWPRSIWSYGSNTVQQDYFHARMSRSAARFARPCRLDRLDWSASEHATTLRLFRASCLIPHPFFLSRTVRGSSQQSRSAVGKPFLSLQPSLRTVDTLNIYLFVRGGNPTFIIYAIPSHRPIAMPPRDTEKQQPPPPPASDPSEALSQCILSQYKYWCVVSLWKS